MLRTPVALFLFNRPDTTRQIFAEIAKVRPQHLLVVADGPRHTAEAALCQEARAVLEGVNWECQVETLFAETNLGCGRRVSSGLDWVFERVPEAIILEDDCLPTPSFFGFCEELLARYRDDERVMMIGGTNLLHDLPTEESYVFSRYFAVWGWASWRRAWAHYDVTMARWPQLKAARQIEALYGNQRARRYLTEVFDRVHAGKVDTWDVQWLYACLFNNGLSVVPRVNLVSNIGTVGTHSQQQDSNHLRPLGELSLPLKHPDMVHPHFAFDESFFNQQFKVPWRAQFLRAVAHSLPPSLKAGLKATLQRG